VPVYVIGIGKVIDDSWTSAYGAHVHAIVHKHGGKYLSRSANITPLEGDPPDATMAAVVEFPSLESARAFFDDPAYAEHQRARQAGAVATFFAIDDTDALGTVPYLRRD
jgi:uncharacterized protein (DUF1330 family)